MRTDVAIDKLCNIAPIIANMAEELAHDEEFKKITIDYAAKKMTQGVFMLRVIPIILKSHRENAFEILSVWKGKSVDEIKAQSIGVTINEVKEIFNDEDFRSFFSSSSASGSVAEG